MSRQRLPRKSSPRIEQKRQDARREILKVSESLLAEEGIDAVTLATIAGRMNLTKQALYHYFPSKEALVRALTTSLLHEEIEALMTAIRKAKSRETVLGVMIRAFHRHYIKRLDAFRSIYYLSQLHSSGDFKPDPETLREQINPSTRQLFDLLEDRLAIEGMSKTERAGVRRLAYSAWLAALGLVSMLGVAEATADPLIHSDRNLLDTLADVFDGAVRNRFPA